MILMIDNYDSFTYNLVQYLGELKNMPEVYRNDKITVEDALRLRPEKLIVSPGPCTPDKAGISKDIIRTFAEKGIPTLGVCLGHQAFAEEFGATVSHAPYLMHGKLSSIEHDGKGLFMDIPSPFEAVRYHSLTVLPDSVPDELEVSAKTPDGIIMGFRHRTLPIFSVQFHPESILSEYGHKLLRNFLEIKK
ncbi:MAG: aminodeoxychorismate/anthranilate synthase component II [Verrucomicrobiota bacterium]|nr:aminodeoxychorismate/anthranilate synthase component II [Verrucomicrobiota bacterium]